MTAKPDRMKLYLIAIVAIVAIVAIMTALGSEKPIGFISDDDASIGGEASLDHVGQAPTFACFGTDGALFSSERPCR